MRGKRLKPPCADQPDSFGWVSIALHWITAVIVILLWYFGFSIRNSEGAAEFVMRRDLHVAIALVVWLVLAARIAWRFRVRHPRASGQSAPIHRLAMSAHYLMLALLLVMLLSGPLLAWASADSIGLFWGLEFPVAAEPHPGLARLAFSIHTGTALMLLGLVVVHVLAAFKHLMFHNDDTFVRMLWPRRD